MRNFITIVENGLVPTPNRSVARRYSTRDQLSTIPANLTDEQVIEVIADSLHGKLTRADFEHIKRDWKSAMQQPDVDVEAEAGVLLFLLNNYAKDTRVSRVMMALMIQRPDMDAEEKSSIIFRGMAESLRSGPTIDHEP